MQNVPNWFVGGGTLFRNEADTPPSGACWKRPDSQKRLPAPFDPPRLIELRDRLPTNQILKGLAPPHQMRIAVATRPGPDESGEEPAERVDGAGLAGSGL